MANVTVPEFSRGMEVVYNILKDGKAHTRTSLKSALAKQGIKKSIFGRCFRLGRIGRAKGLFDVVIVRNRDDKDKSTAQLVKGAAAKKSIAEKDERYANLAGSHKSKKSAKSTKAKAKVVAKKAPAKKAVAKKSPAKKTAAKKSTPKKVAVTAGGSEASSDNEVLES